MKAFDVVDLTIAILEDRPKRLPFLEIVPKPITFECEVVAEVLDGLKLDGFIEVNVWEDEDGLHIEDRQLTIKDKDGRDCKVDFEELWPRTQDKIDDQVVKAFNDWRPGA